MRFYTPQHPFYCGIALPARTLSLCVLNQEGERQRHRHMPAGPAPLLTALTGLAQPLARAVSQMLKRPTAGAPDVELAALGTRLHCGRCRADGMASRTLRSPEALYPEPGPLMGQPLPRCERRRRRVRLSCAAPLPRLHLTGARLAFSPLFVEDGTRVPRSVSGAETTLGRLCASSSLRRATRNTCVVPPRWCTSKRQGRQNTLPGTTCARPDPQWKKMGNIRSEGASVS
jgi:hypothetical protein